ncbi:hypothetical protein TIFTF001_046167 [Ficus carica]|uniref:Uncharacterized protein n=1 Tax=Ficus carica TaxID=3494 RepID=A0AA88CQZ0_FICCA|nr:hypothetical protein TIFTF001_046164 [Ficus carica]GMN27700.1 hypothetical protein TIFTF001_046167 [Ficus carica]
MCIRNVYDMYVCMFQDMMNVKSMYGMMQYVVSTRVRSGLVHGLSWTGLAAPTTPWQRATVSKLIAMLDTRQWSMARQTVKL